MCVCVCACMCVFLCLDYLSSLLSSLGGSLVAIVLRVEMQWDLGFTTHGSRICDSWLNRLREIAASMWTRRCSEAVANAVMTATWDIGGR